jgi:serine/threonine protein kinase
MRKRLEDFLTQVPVAARQSLRSAADPTGRTINPNRQVNTKEALAQMLPSRLPRFKVGDQPLPGDWVLEELLGIGGFAEVWKARHRVMTHEPSAALKFCLTAAPQTLEHEAKVIYQLQQRSQHPGIVRLQETYLQTDPPCLRYEYVSGGDLADLIRSRIESGGVDPREMTQWILQLAQTVAEAHRLKVVHGDLKPANVLVQRLTRGGVLLRVTDFGIGGMAAEYALKHETRMSASDGYTLPEAVRGAHTPLYASPRQKEGKKATLPCDVHALGMIWYQSLVGNLSAERPSGQGWRRKLEQQGVPVRWLELLERCLDDEPSERPANAGEFALELERLCPSLPPPVESPKKKTARPSGRPSDPPPSPPPQQITSRQPPPMGHKARQKFFLAQLSRFNRAQRNITGSYPWLVVLIHLILTMTIFGVMTATVASCVMAQFYSWNADTRRQIAREMSQPGISLWIDDYCGLIWSNHPSVGEPYEDRIEADYSRGGTAGRVSYEQYRPLSNTPSPQTKALVDRANATVKAAAEAYDRQRPEKGQWPEILGAASGLLAAAPFFWFLRWLRKRKVNRLQGTIHSLAGHLHSEFAAELAPFGNRVNLEDPIVVRELLNALKEA